MNLVTVCISTFNRKDSLYPTLKSVLSQTYRNLEIIIVDDNSTDGTQNLVENQLLKLDKRVRYIKHEVNKGLAAARNTAIAQAKGKYFTYCDDDDELEENSIQERLDCFEFKEKHDNKLAVVYSGCSIDNKSLKKIFYHKPSMCGQIEEDLKNWNLSTIPSSGFYKLSLIQQIGGYDEELKSFVDHDFWLKMSKAGFNSYSLNKPLTKTFVFDRKKSMVTDVTKRIQVIEEFLTKWEDYFSEIMGESRGKLFCNNYRKKVISELAVRNIHNKNFENFKLCYTYLRNYFDLVPLSYFVGWRLVKSFAAPYYHKLVK